MLIPLFCVMKNFFPLQTLLLATALVLTLPDVSRAEVIEIRNSGLEEPGMADVKNVSFDGTHGGMGPVPGWSSNEPALGGAIRIDERYLARTFHR